MSKSRFNNRKGERVAMPTCDAVAGERPLDTLTAEFDDLLARMQTPAARQAMADAFNATPSGLGRAAVAAAKNSSQR